MSNLDKMVEEILAEAAENARRMEQEARREAEAFLETEQQKAAGLAAEQVEQARREAEHILETGRSSAKMERNRQVLAAKQQMITHTLEEARAKLAALPDQEYFNMLVRLAARAARPQEGEICLNQRDLSRLPSGFEETLNQALPPSAGRLRVCPRPRELDGGFVLVYGGVEENSSLSALFAAAQDSLRDIARQILFAV